jgi:hypothetical protein
VQQWQMSGDLKALGVWAAGLVGMAVATVFADALQLPRNLYRIVYFAIVDAFLYTYIR